MRIAPAAFSRCTAAASYTGTKFSRILDAHVVRIPRVEILSFTAAESAPAPQRIDAVLLPAPSGMSHTSA